MKSKNSILVAACALLFAINPASEAAAQMPMAPDAPRITGALLGEDYAGVELGYIRHHGSAPSVMHRYGFVASRPMPDRRNIDGIFHFNHTRGSLLGANGSQNDFTGGLAAFKRSGAVAPFLGADLGWAWVRADGLSTNSFLYQLRAGSEFNLSPNVSLTPAISYQQARRLHEEVWRFSAKAAFRANLDWGATLALHVDDNHIVEIVFGAQRRF